MRHLPLTATIAWCCLIAAGCGGSNRRSPAAVHGPETPQKDVSRAPTTVASPIVAHVRGPLVGDEDDDDEPVKRTGSESDFDSDSDGDYKDSYTGYFDRDDAPLRSFGHVPRAPEGRAIVAVAKRYLLVAAAGNGATACKMLYPALAAAVVEDYGQAPAPSYLWGSTCPAVMGKLFRHEHTRVTTPVEIVSVRVRGEIARVLLGSSALSANSIELHRDRGTWTVYGLLASPLP